MQIWESCLAKVKDTTKGNKDKGIIVNSKYRVVDLRARHFKQVAAVTADYHKYVTVTQKGNTNDSWAAERALRAPDSQLNGPSVRKHQDGKIEDTDPSGSKSVSMPTRKGKSVKDGGDGDDGDDDDIASQAIVDSDLE